VRFNERVRKHAADYKRTVLGVTEDGLWKGKPYPHILPYKLDRLNILPSIRDQFWTQFPDMEIQLHRDFHHLNSSQAVAFNLFYPAMVGLDAGTLLTQMGIHKDQTDQKAFVLFVERVESEMAKERAETIGLRTSREDPTKNKPKGTSTDS
jgi:hypothetical protein